METGTRWGTKSPSQWNDGENLNKDMKHEDEKTREEGKEERMFQKVEKMGEY